MNELAPLARLPGVRLVSLQYGAGREQLRPLLETWPLIDLGDLEFPDKAGVMRNLDLVVSVDSAPAHLAGGLGVPVWVALSFDPDFRWLPGSGRQPLVSDHASVPPERTRPLAGRLRAHGCRGRDDTRHRQFEGGKPRMSTISEMLETAIQHQRSGQFLRPKTSIGKSWPRIRTKWMRCITWAWPATSSAGARKRSNTSAGPCGSDPGFAEAHNSLGVALSKAGKLEDAAQSYRQALGVRPDLAHVHNNLGLVLTQQGKLGEAEACYRRALLREPRDHRIHNSLGYALKQQGKLAEAMGCLSRGPLPSAELRHRPQ